MTAHHAAPPHHEKNDDDDVCSDESSNDPDPLTLLHNNPQQQLWRELEQADADERYEEEEENDNNDGSGTMTLPDGRTILDYNTYLANQRYYDDLKHVDYNFIHFDNNESRGGVLIEQDKSLGKGGLCWDAAFILAEYLAQELLQLDSSRPPIKMIELGCGTGVCGLLLAHQLQQSKSSIRPWWNLDLTDLPALQPLLQRNLSCYYSTGRHDEGAHADEDLEAMVDRISNKQQQDQQGQSMLLNNNNTEVQAFALDWETVSQHQHQQQAYDIVLGADVVATLYNPVALVDTIGALCHATSVVYVSCKERLSTLHREFEQELQRQFASVEIIIMGDGQQPLSRNRNPDIRILVARSKRTVHLTGAETDSK